MFCLLALFVLTTAPSPLADSLPVTPRRGSLIRIVERSETRNPREAFLEAVSGDSLWYRDQAGGQLLATGCSALEHVEVSVGQRGHSLLGAFVGGAAGLAGGLLANPPEPNPGPFDFGASALNSATPLLAFAGGAVVGAIVGGQIRSPRWKPIASPCAIAPVRPIRPGDRVRAHPKGGGLPVAGYLEADSTGVIQLRATDGTGMREITLDTMESIDRRGPGGSQAGQRAVIGGLIGAAIGVGLGPWLTGGQPEAGQLTALGGLIGGAVAGAAFGALTGRGVQNEQWLPIPIEQLKRMGVRVSLCAPTGPPPLAGRTKLRWQGRTTLRITLL